MPTGSSNSDRSAARLSISRSVVAPARRSTRRSSSWRRSHRISRIWRSRSPARITEPVCGSVSSAAQVAGAEVERVDLEPIGRMQAGEAEREAHQRRRGAAAGDPEQQQVALVEVPADRVLRLAARLVGHRDHRTRAVLGPDQLGEVDLRRQRLRPRLARGRDALGLVGLDDRVDEPRQVRRLLALRARPATPRARARGRRTRTATTSTASSLSASVTHVISAVWIGTTSSGPEPEVGAARPVAADLRRGALVDHVDGVGDVLHAQRDPQVRVGPDVVVDDARGTLGGEDQVHAERPPALGHVDQRRQQLGLLARHLGELVDHDHEPRQRLVVVALVVGAQVVGAGAAQQPLAVLELGLQRAQRALDRAPRRGR